MVQIKEIGLGGGCHWCTEAVFQSLRGVFNVKQGFVASEAPYDAFSEAVIVAYAPKEISLSDLVLIHLLTHESTAVHRLRQKYRSAIYTLDPEDEKDLEQIWDGLQLAFSAPLITMVLPFKAFRPSNANFQNYYRSDPDRPFCKRYIDPKLQLLRHAFAEQVTTTSKRDQ
jgi:peptide-methionine (S)-S-oxide reductase